MNKTRSAKVDRGGPTARIHTFYASPGLQSRRMTAGEFNLGLRLHRSLDRLPLAFRDARGRTVMVASTSDLTKTLFFLPREDDAFLNGLEIREITEETLAE